ncbi:MAG: DNA mismatch repair protein MutS [Candidatus Thorarchaeota archaeon]
MKQRKFGRKTKAMEQYERIKRDYPDTIVFFQLGDFYETFNEDAKITSKVLEIALTSRSAGGDGGRIPLAGIPVKAIDQYLGKMVQEGYKIAIVDQLEDAKAIPSGKIVKRGVTRVATPGTVFETSILDRYTNNFLMSIVINERRHTAGMALIDISTSDFFVTEFADDLIKHFRDEFSRFKPREILVPDSINRKGKLHTALEDIITSESKAILSPINETLFNLDTATQSLLDHFEVKSLAAFGIDTLNEGIRAAGAILSHLAMLKKEYPSNITSLQVLQDQRYLVLDASTQKNLEIIENAFDRRIEGSLLSIYTDICTNMGARLIRRWLLQPLRDQMEITARLDAVAAFFQDLRTSEQIRDYLNEIADLHRIVSKVKYNSANARDLVVLKNSLVTGLELSSYLQDQALPCQICTRITQYDVSGIQAMVDLIGRAINESPPTTLQEGGIINPSFNPELLELYDVKNNQDAILKQIETKEQQRTSFNIKLGYNSVHGYYIEATKAQLREAGEAGIPGEYVRRQTLVNAERFITPELKKIEERILNIDEKISTLEYKIFCEIREQITPFAARVRAFSDLVAELDVLLCFAFTARKNNYCRPEINDEPTIDIQGGRHPVVEQLQRETGFVANDVLINDGELHIITGPNMSGKSTFIRQVALIALMAQAGSWVPAHTCRMGIVDRIFTRIGAFDRLAFGQSTFMLEMLETANILRNATPQSLIILDEVGRGTSTFDGLSLAWSVAEYIATSLNAKTLFATHYHQLAELEQDYPIIKNYHQTATERNGKLILLYKIKKGSTDHSFGISVAKMAGVPKPVITNAQKKLLELEEHSGSNSFLKPIKGDPTRPRQMSLAEALAKNVSQQQLEQEFKNLRMEILAVLKNYVNIDVNYKTPIDALRELGELVNDLRELEKKLEGK